MYTGYQQFDDKVWLINQLEKKTLKQTNKQTNKQREKTARPPPPKKKQRTKNKTQKKKEKKSKYSPQRFLIYNGKLIAPADLVQFLNCLFVPPLYGAGRKESSGAGPLPILTF